MTCSDCDFATEVADDEGAWEIQQAHTRDCPGPPYRLTRRARREARRRQDRIERKLG